MTRRAGIVSAVIGILAVLTGGLTSCGLPLTSITVGAKDFSEQRILAEMIAQLAEVDGIRVDRIVPYPSGLSPYTGLEDGTIDVYVEYTGTGLLAQGLPPVVDGDLAFDLVQQASAGDDLTWLPRLGFGNDYVLAVTPETAQRVGLTRISDLANGVLPPLRLATSTDYPRRPLDGLAALASRYGLTVDPGVLATDDKSELYGALRSGEVDVAVGFSTDPELRQFELVVLDDDLSFFPAYDAAPIARTSLLARYPELVGTLESLAGTIDAERMSELIRQVDLEQRDPAVVAREALAELGLIDGSPPEPRGDAVVVAIGLDDELAGATGRAIEAIRDAYVGRPVTVITVEDPADAVVRGDARIAIADAETIFRPTDRDAGGERPVKPLEAVAAVELRSVQLLARPGTDEVTSIVVGGPGSPSNETARTLIAAEVRPDLELAVLSGSTISERAGVVLDGGADAALVVRPLGQPEVQQALDDGMVLVPLPVDQDELALAAPHLRAGRIPARSYVGVAEPVDTVSQQTVVAGPVSEGVVPGIHGPGAFVGGPGQPLSSPAVQSIRTSLSEPRVDPVLPRAPAPVTDPSDLTQPTNPSPWTSVATIAVLLAVAALVWALLKPQPRVEQVAPQSSEEESDSVPARG